MWQCSGWYPEHWPEINKGDIQVFFIWDCSQLSKRNEGIQLQDGQKENVLDVQVTLQWKGTSLLQLCLTLWTDATLDWCKTWSAIIHSWENDHVKSVRATKKDRGLWRPPGGKQTSMFYDARATTAEKGRKHKMSSASTCPRVVILILLNSLLFRNNFSKTLLKKKIGPGTLMNIIYFLK